MVCFDPKRKQLLGSHGDGCSRARRRAGATRGSTTARSGYADWAQRAFSGIAKPVVEAAAGAHDCVSCHGRVRPPIPGIPGFPFPPPRDPPVSRDTPKDPPARGPKEAPKQCDIQNERDTDICVRQPNSTAQAMCHSSASERYSWCKRTGGEVGWPELFTHPAGPRR
jgi:hypothetical protein